MPFISDSYRNITTTLLLIQFNNLFLLPVNIPSDNYATCKAFPFIIAVLYTHVPTVVPPTDSRRRSNGLHDVYATMLGGSRDMLPCKNKIK